LIHFLDAEERKRTHGTNGGGETKPDTHSLDQSERHLTILTDYRNPNGEPLALVLCRFDMRTHAVTQADLTNGRTRADDRAEGYVRIPGLCL
jgi:hypothetical protein